MLNKKIKSIIYSFTTLAVAGLFAVFAFTQKAFASGDQNGEAQNYYQENEIEEFCVSSFSPEGELPSTRKYPSIQVLFSQPVVPLAKLGEETDQSDVFTIDPPMNGVFRWFGTSMLSFECKDEIPPQTEYTVTVNPNLKSINGESLKGKNTFKFHSEELKPIFLRPAYKSVQEGEFIDRSSVPPELANSIALFFNYNVQADYIKDFIKITAAGRSYKFKVEQLYDYAVLLTLDSKDAFPYNSTVTVNLLEGASSQEGFLKTSQARSLSFNIGPSFSFIQSYTDNWASYYYKDFVCLTFTRALKAGQEDAILAGLTISEKSKGESVAVSKENIVVEGSSLVIHDLKLTKNKYYTVQYKGDLYDIYGKKISGTITTEFKYEAHEQSYARFHDSGFNILEAAYAPKIAFKYMNVNKGEYSLRPVIEGVRYENPEKVVSETVTSKASMKDVPVIQTVSLEPALKKTPEGYRGAAYFEAKFNVNRYQYWNNRTVREDVTNSQVIQVTDLGMTIRFDYDHALVLVSKLSTGKPVKNATVNFYESTERYSYSPKLWQKGRVIATAKTDSKGLAVVNFKSPLKTTDGIFAEACTEYDSVYCSPNNTSMWNTDSYRDSIDAPITVDYKTFMFSDRYLYKPGETVTFKGIDRKLYKGTYTANHTRYNLSLTDGSWWSPDIILELGDGETSENGTFSGSFVLPEDIEPGTYSIQYSANGRKQNCYITIQYFERLRFEASTSVPDMTFISGDELSATVKANYLGGGSMGGSSYETSWERNPTYFHVSKGQFENYTFGPRSGYDSTSYLSSTEGKLDPDGKANLSLQSGGEKLKGTPYRYKVSTTISDSGSQSVGTSSSMIVHPAKFYIGVSPYKNVSTFPQANSELKMDYACVTPENKLATADDLSSEHTIKMELIHDKWVKVQQLSVTGRVYTRWEQETTTEDERTITINPSQTKAEISVTPKEGGEYLLRLTSVDSLGNEVITEKPFYVTSSNMSWYYNSDNNEIRMTPNKSLYEVGETAHIFMESPLPSGTYLITTEREGIISHQVKTFNSPTTTIDVKIQDSFVPVMYVTVSSYSVRTEEPRETYDDVDLGKPKGYFGLARLNVSTKTRSFDIEVVPSKNNYLPGEEAEVTLYAKDSKGKPLANAEITLMAVDRGVIDLVDYHVPDPVEFFWSQYNFPDCVKGGDSRYYLMDPVTFESKNLIGGDEGGDKLNERKNFDPTAVFIPSLVTDSKGKVTCKFVLPDTLTAYRITAVGVKQNNFSITEKEISVANPVSVRQVLPRQLRVSDECELGAVISNLDNAGHSVSVTLNIYSGVEKSGMVQNVDQVQKLPGKASLIGDSQKEILVAADSTSPLMFNIKAEDAGWITLEYIIKSDVLSEKLLVPLQIQKPYIYETVTTVGQVDDPSSGTKNSVVEEIIIPSDIDDGVGRLKVVLDPTRLGTLTEAVSYVFHYPYGCMEQRSAAVLPLAIFADYIDVFGMKNEVKNPLKVVEAELKQWKNVQLYDGGYPYWPTGSVSNDYVSARIGEIFGICKQKGINVDSYANINKLCSYLYSNATASLNKQSYYTGMNEYRAAYDFYVLSLLDYKFNTQYLETIRQSQFSDTDTNCLVALTYLNLGDKAKAKEIEKDIRRYCQLETRGMHINSMVNRNGFYYDYYSRSEPTTYALLLELCTRLNPKDKFNQNILYELSYQQKLSHGYWQSTSSTARVLSAIATYTEANDLTNLNFTASANLEGNKIISGQFKGAAAKPVEGVADFKKAPLSSLPRDKALKLQFQKEGKGSLYYTASMKYAIPADQQDARDEGISIYVQYIDRKTNKPVTGDELVQGETYKAVVRIASPKEREFVAVRVPVPSGCEIVNAAFKTSGMDSIENSFRPDDDDEGDYYYFDWEYYDSFSDDELYYLLSSPRSSYRYYNYYWGPLSNQTIYDNEVQYFFDDFYNGYQELSFYFRATRQGTFQTPSATAECMYQEEIFGRSQGKIWKIVEGTK